MNMKLHTSALVFFAIFLSAQSVWAHPHIWIDVEVHPQMSENRLNSLRIIWAFDEMYSSSYLIDFDTDNSRSFDVSESAQIYDLAFKHLIQNNYFTYVQVNGQPLTIPEATDFLARYEDDILYYEFTLPMNQAVNSGDRLTVICMDPTIYIDFFMLDDASQAVLQSVQVQNVAGVNTQAYALRFVM